MLRHGRTIRCLRYLDCHVTSLQKTFCKNYLMVQPPPSAKKFWETASSASTSTRNPYSSFAGAPNQQSESQISASEYENISDETLDSLAEIFEDLGDEDCTGPEYDVQYASGVLTIKFGPAHGTYVINKQSPNKQIWLSSPTSGPKRYDFKEKTWLYKYETENLHELLSREISKVLEKQVDFTNCSYGSKS